MRWALDRGQAGQAAFEEVLFRGLPGRPGDFRCADHLYPFRVHQVEVADQVGGPTPASAIADACLTMATQLRENPAKSGTYHFSGTPDLSWADFAREIFALSNRTIFVEDIPTSAFPTPAKRPQNSRLDCSATHSTFGISRPLWKPALAQMLTELESVRS